MLEASEDGQNKGMKAHLDQIRERVAKLEAAAITAEKLELLQMKINELERATDAHRKHLQNLESKVDRSTNGLKGFRQ